MQPEDVKKMLKIKNYVGEALSGSSKYESKSIYGRCVLAAYLNGVEKGAQYAYALCANGSMRKMGVHMSCRVVSEIDAKEFEHNGEKPFELVEEKDRYPCFMMRKRE